MKLKFLFLFIFSVPIATNLYSQQDSIRIEKKDGVLKKYWNSFIYGNIDRTFERKTGNKSDYVYKISKHFHIGGAFNLNYASLSDIKLRIEFKHNVNTRVDYGFGKDTGGFVFNFAEAF